VVTLSKTPSARNQIKVAAISENQKTRVSAIRDKQTKVSASRKKSFGKLIILENQPPIIS
jgi:hypothetical protein